MWLPLAGHLSRLSLEEYSCMHSISMQRGFEPACNKYSGMLYYRTLSSALPHKVSDDGNMLANLANAALLIVFG